jgi:hypothetical protein
VISLESTPAKITVEYSSQIRHRSRDRFRVLD